MNRRQFLAAAPGIISAPALLHTEEKAKAREIIGEFPFNKSLVETLRADGFMQGIPSECEESVACLLQNQVCHLDRMPDLTPYYKEWRLCAVPLALRVFRGLIELYPGRIKSYLATEAREYVQLNCRFVDRNNINMLSNFQRKIKNIDECAERLALLSLEIIDEFCGSMKLHHSSQTPRSYLAPCFWTFFPLAEFNMLALGMNDNNAIGVYCDVKHACPRDE